MVRNLVGGLITKVGLGKITVDGIRQNSPRL